MLLSQQSSVIEAGELGLSVSEVLRYLNLYGVPGEYVGNADCLIKADCALAAFEAFEILLESNIGNLTGAFVNLSELDGVLFKLNLENMQSGLDGGTVKRLADVGVSYEINTEDSVAYIRFILPKGGEAV